MDAASSKSYVEPFWITCGCGLRFNLRDDAELNDWIEHACPVLGSWDD
jgi:hypothetical protein